ncbi:hypothetical protein ACFVGM_38510 [Kitasatospora purpeofusca]|uniref:hypothetical protein n=1 Tax=Kitasatospora purpeofusca TaxID=67352 RepID=UPI00367989F6
MRTLQGTATKVGRNLVAELVRAEHAAVRAGESAVHRSAHRIDTVASELEGYGGQVAARARNAQHRALPQPAIPGRGGRTHRRGMAAGLVCTGLLALGGGVLTRRRAARKAARG